MKMSSDPFEDDRSESLTVYKLDKYKRSLSPGATATKPKYVLEVNGKLAYFKFELTEKEICAELLSSKVGKCLGIPIAETFAAEYKGTKGIVSFDIGEYTEVDDSESYSVKDYTNIPGFIDMCLFDYLVMNEDRHARNWGISNNAVAPLFDHNVTFGADLVIKDLDYFMEKITSAFSLHSDYDNSWNVILKYMCQNYADHVKSFIQKLDSINDIQNHTSDLTAVDQLVLREKIQMLGERRQYMVRKVDEYLV